MLTLQRSRREIAAVSSYRQLKEKVTEQLQRSRREIAAVSLARLSEVSA